MHQKTVNYKRLTIQLIAIASLLRLFVAFTTGLGNDEVYYRLYASVLQWNYFDHPPMVGWLIRLTTGNLLFDQELFIRLGAILFCAASTWLMYKSGKLLKNEFAGFLAAAMYTTSVYTSVIAGTFILPDSPQVFFWLAAIYSLLKITNGTEKNAQVHRQLLSFGFLTGIAMLCKVHTVFLWFGLMLYVFFYSKKWLTYWSLYAAALIAFLCFLPIIIWNFQNDFITFFFHGNRVNVAHSGLHVDSFATFVIGQILYCNPLVFMMLLFSLRSRSNNISINQKRLLLFVSIPIIVVATALSLFRDLLPHWTGPGFIGWMLLAAVHYAGKQEQKEMRLPLLLKWSLALIAFIAIAGIVLINFFPGTIGSKEADKLGDGDFTLDMVGWKQFGKEFNTLYRQNDLKKSGDTALIVCGKWFPAAHIEQYVAKGLPVKVIGYGPIEDIHQYHWLNRQRIFIRDSTEIYVIIPSNNKTSVDQFDFLKNSLPDFSDTIVQYRNGIAARKFFIYHFAKGKYVFDESLY